MTIEIQSITIGWPQAIYLFCVISNIYINAKYHGESNGERNAFVSVLASILGLSILYCGGFFG